jgi:protein-S-isoprenylcysteine O-methyltransferase Ste14
MPQRQPEQSHVPGAANLGFARPPFVYLAASLLGIGLDAAWPLPLLGEAIATPIGIAMVCAGVALFILSARTFRSAGTPLPGNRPTTTIVRAGPYRFSRNPIYLAFSALQLGVAFWANTWWVVITLVPALALMTFVVIPREERYLEARFPSEYPAYKASVRRWL